MALPRFLRPTPGTRGCPHQNRVRRQAPRRPAHGSGGSSWTCAGPDRQPSAVRYRAHGSGGHLDTCADRDRYVSAVRYRVRGGSGGSAHEGHLDLCRTVTGTCQRSGTGCVGALGARPTGSSGPVPTVTGTCQRPGTGCVGAPGGSAPREDTTGLGEGARRAPSSRGCAKLGRRRVATGANHPASQSSAFRRGPGTPAGAPTGDQSTGLNATPKPTLMHQTRNTSGC
jgi:hypothetical protein